MSAMEMPHHHHHHHIDLEQQGSVFRLHHHLDLSDDDHLSCFSDAEDGGSIYSSQFYSTTAGSYDDDYTFACEDSRRVSSVSGHSVVKVGSLSEEENKAAVAEAVEKDCRICQLGLESNSGESGIPIELGCSCKDDLAAAHKHCAETWFKIKGNKTCEICNSVAKNVVGVTEAESVVVVEHSTVAAAASSSAAQNSETNRSFWQGHRFLNFLLACMVFAFVISWLFHFNVPSS
ncbi:hypothetical protein LINPERHAP1_LOCUS41025 [Linum perenne]